MKIKGTAFCIGLILAPIALNVHAEPATLASIVHLIEETGQLKSADQMLPSIIRIANQRLKIQYPNMPEEALSIINQEMARGFKEKFQVQLLEKVVPIYAKYYSEEDIQQLIQFYQTPLGKKELLVTPLMQLDIFKVSQQLAIEMAPDIWQRIIERFKEKGYIKQPQQKS